VTKGPGDLAGRHVFALHPHQSRFRVPAQAVLPVPDGVPAARAILAANMETALNALWDARLSPGARCLVVGAGLLGWLVTILLSRRGDMSVHLTDIDPGTGVKADDFRVRFLAPDQVGPGAYDLAFHCAAAEAGLQTAIDALDFEGTVIELSWYGDRTVSVRLGGNFHANRLRILSSQVGHVANARRASTTRRERLALALAALADDRIDGLITGEIPFLDLPGRLPHVLADRAPGIATRIVY
jgi:threonine dehydrogenase-like Zn-dependent dehydrogenase